MSFYGKIYTTLGNAFKRFKFINSGKNNTTVLSEFSSDDVLLQADAANDYAIIESGNAWVGFADVDGNCKIYHAKPQVENSNQVQDIVYEIDNSGDSYDSLITFGNIITIQSPTFDAAGHINGYQSKRYKLEEVPDLSEVAFAVQDVETLNTVVGLPLPEGEDLPGATLLNRVDILENTFNKYDDRIETLESATDTYLELKRNDDGVIIGSNLVDRVGSLETKMGDLTDTGVEVTKLTVPVIFGDLSSVGIEPETSLSVASILGDLSQVSVKRTSLAEILGDLDSAVGENKNFAEELGALRNNVSLILKHLGL